jgi:hypothetical protein
VILPAAVRASLEPRMKLLTCSRSLAFVRDALGPCDPRPRALQKKVRPRFRWRAPQPR